MTAEEVPGLAAVTKAFGLTLQNADGSNGTNDTNGTNGTSDTPNGSTTGAEGSQDNTTDEAASEAEKPASNEVKEEASEKTEKADKGSVSTVHNLYRSAKDDDGEWTWVDEYPKDVKEAAENEETEKFALIVRNKKSQDSRKKLEAHSIIIQSKWLKAALAVILEDYPGITCELHRLIFEAPFRPFVHRWVAFLKYMQRPDLDQTTKEHLQLLHDILKYEIGDMIKEFEDYVLNGVCTFGSLWMIFQPGGVIASAHRGPLSAFELVDSDYVSNQCGTFLKLECDCVEWDGEKFGRYTEEIMLPSYGGTKKISSLKAVPLPFCEGKEKLKLSLIERGKKFEQLAGHHFKAYNGPAITWDDRGQEKVIHISSRIIVDTSSFNRFSPHSCRYIDDFNEKDIEKLAKYNEENGTQEAEEDSEVNIDGSASFKEEIASFKADEPTQVKLTPYHQMLCRSRVRGYALETKEWLDFFVSLVSEIKWNDNAFENLVLPEAEKETVLAFSESQVMNRAAFDDVIAGKGRGAIMLLSGSPGVGKTLTAEAVAEHMRRPLHSITSGDLGSDAWAVERALTRALRLVGRWNAVLLIDECDVFLEARSNNDLARNQMVSIFLRTLEYFQGILFMTTNRCDNIDPAFDSRIHVSLPYPDLTNESRRKIWDNFLKSSPHSNSITSEDLDDLCTLVLNGRQIKNVLKTAQLLALRKKKTLDRSFVETVLSIQRKRPAMQS